MKLFSMLALMVALGLAPAYAQQEVDPDHFDSPASKPVVQQSHHAQQASLSRNHHKRVHLASRNAGKAHHRRASA